MPPHVLSEEMIGLLPQNLREILESLKHLAPADDRISGTAVKADPAKQVSRPVPIGLYWDRDRKCVRCSKRFIFFAVEQKHWYEVLGFAVESQANHCPSCRKNLQKLARQRRCYENLVHQPKLTPEEIWEFADCVFSLIEEGLFGVGPKVKLRSLLKRIPPELRDDPRHKEALARLQKLKLKL